jgi:histidine ammonia-lyase
VITLDGERLTLSDIVAVADGAPIRLGPAARDWAGAAHALAVRIGAERTIYGRTTGVGANKDTPVDASAGAKHGARLLHSHATAAGPVRDPRRVRAAMAIRLNQLAAGGSGARVEVLDALAALLDSGQVPPVREHGGVGTGDLGALATIALALPGVAWTADDALPFLSSNAATLADAALAADRLLSLARAGIAVAATTFVAVEGQLEAFSETVEEITPQPGTREVCAAMRRLVWVGAEVPTARRLQDPFALRCLPQVQGLALDALAALVALVETASATAAENPLVDRQRAEMVHHGGFHAAYLASALDTARLAVANAAALSVRRVAMLLDPEVSGLAPFLGDGTPGASGAMGLEYAAGSALGDLRALAAPASLQTVSLSRGVEDDASYASLAARQALDAVAPYAVVLAAELVGAVRAVRLRGLVPPAEGWGAVAQACAELPGASMADLGEMAEMADLAQMADRDLTPDLEAAAAVLPALARLVSPSGANTAPTG